jgi:hypothetical protein
MRLAMDQKALCSDCFSNIGLRTEAARIGKENDEPCRNCSSKNGRELDDRGLANLMTRFFVEGSQSPYLPPVYRIDYSQVGKSHDPVRFDETLQRDYELIAARHETLRYHAPKLRIMGFGGPYSDFSEALKLLDEQGDRTPLKRSAADILGRCAELYLEPGQRLYRIRTNPEKIQKPEDIDTPPSQIGACKKAAGRFESSDLPILYTSSDVETVLHEARVRLGDEVVLGTLEVSKRQKLVDLDLVKEQVDASGFNLNADYHYFLRSRLGSQDPSDYRICQILAVEARLAGFDGLKFRSFYSILRQNYEASVNYALFGFPIKENRLMLVSWNSIRLLKASYAFQFGPLPHTLRMTEP